jgi:hypothetical protein
MDKTQIHLGEIQTQLTFAKRAFEEYLCALAASDVASLFYHAHHFLLHATNIDKLIDVDASSFRGQYLASLFSGNSIDLTRLGGFHVLPSTEVVLTHAGINTSATCSQE